MVSLSTETSVLNVNKINSMFNSITPTLYRSFLYSIWWKRKNSLI